MVRLFEQHSPVRREYPNEGGKASLIIFSKAEMGALKTQLEKSIFNTRLSWRVSLNCKTQPQVKQNSVETVYETITK